ncbi:short transient receptor potential channel 4 [Microplitis demolitor]|uniref:short transient receptor potential channel 4 n=1 Tax=Microplitis demolitor TaxID=69319 RepID=UPI0004CD01E0|nr:short transient receptor potential channel 4 [Microplitis demolitor]
MEETEAPDAFSDEELDKVRCHGVILPQLDSVEKHFFDFVANGNLNCVKNFIETNPHFRINSVNYQNLSVLHVAVAERDLPMLELLLSVPNIDCSDAALHAIRDNQQRMAVMILNKMEEQSPNSEFTGAIDSSEFLDETTPMDVAAAYGHFEMIKLLASRGHFIRKPHPPDCYCEEICKPERENEDPLTLDKKRLARYQAFSNPAHICHVSSDPILKAFQLSVELDRAAVIQRELHKSYRQLSQDVTQFAAELIGCARKADEVEHILERKAGMVFSMNFTLPRLLLAVECKQKTFVAHPNVQQIIENKWMGEWYGWKKKSRGTKIATVFLRIPIFWFMALWVWLAPNSKRGRKWQIPVHRYISIVASYLVFLTICFFQSNINKKNQLRGPPNTGCEIPLVIYVISFIWAAIRLCMIHGPSRYFRSRWNWYEVIMLVLFIMTFIFWIASAIDVRLHDQRDLERKYWHKYDPTLVAEGSLCIATIMAFFKLIFLCQLDYNLGLLQVSLGRMIQDATKFLLLFTIIIFAFAAGLARLYQYYDGMVQVDDESKIKTQQVSSFVDFLSTLKTLFWAIFCMSAIESADVIIENLPGESDTETIINQHSFTEGVGYLAFAGFECISVIVVLNMLIACMSNTFTAFTRNVDIEWTFGRTEVYVNIMAQNALPPPFNLLPTCSEYRTIVEFIKLLFRPTKTKRARWNFKHGCYIENIAENDNEKYGEIMGLLVMRYFRQKHIESATNEIRGLRKDISELKYLLKDALSSP